MPSRGGHRIVRDLVLGAAAALLLSAADALGHVAAEGAPRSWSELYAVVALGTLPGGLLGPIAGIAIELAARTRARLVPAREPRSAAAALAVGLTALAVVGATWGLAARAVPGLLGLQDLSLLGSLLVLLPIAVAAASLSLRELPNLLAPHLAGLARALRLHPDSAVSWVPTCLLVTLALYQVAWHYAVELGTLALWMVMLSWALLFVCARALIPPSAPSGRLLAWVAPLALLAAGAGSTAYLTRLHGGSSLLRESILPSSTADRLAALTDVDRDGYGVLFGQRDCAPFDAARNPSADEILDNQIDDNCDGRDGLPQVLDRGEQRSRYRLEPAQVRHYNIVLIVIDAVRADRRGKMHAGRKLTPEIDRFAGEAFDFRQAYSQAPATALSVASLLAGQPPLQLRWGVRRGVPQPLGTHESLTTWLKKAGYRTHLVANRWVHDNMSRVSREFDGQGHIWMGRDYQEGRRGSAPSSTTRAIEFIEEHTRSERAQPFFLVVYYEDPHSPYENLSARGMAAGGQKPWDRYNAEVAYADKHVGYLLDYLRNKPELWSNSVVVVTSDHGEEFEEHGHLYHGNSCYVESAHVPLVMRVPGFEARRVEDQVSLLDITPTVLQLVGLSRTPAVWGQSLLATALDAQAPERPSYCASFVDDNPARLTRSVRSGGFTLVSAPGGGIELYDQAADPAEKNSRADDAKLHEVRAELEALLDAGGRAVRRP